MKYYIRLNKYLLKNKKYLGFFGYHFIIIIVIIYICTMMHGGMINGLEYTGSVNGSDNPIVIVLSSTNIGMILLSLFVLWILLYFTPKVSIYTTDNSEFEVTEIDDNIHVKYGNHEFLYKKNGLENHSLKFKDKNKRFVLPSTEWRVFNYIYSKHIFKTKAIYEKSSKN